MTGFFSKSHIKVEESAMNYIKIFQNAQALSVSVENYYSENQLKHIFLDNFTRLEIFCSNSYPPGRVMERRNNCSSKIFIYFMLTD